MQNAASILLLSLSFTTAEAEPAPVAPPPAVISQAEANEQELLRLAENFKGEESIPKMQALLARGTNPNATDSEGNTPLLLLCKALEMDYRYRNNPHYAQAVDKAFTLLLRNKASAMHENRYGCNAVFYLQSKPELKAKLTAQKLIPKELAVRIPYEPLALRRYMQLRIAQAKHTTHRECLDYLSRCYCAPAYARVKEKLDAYLSAESGRNIPEGAIADCLAFLRLANEKEAKAYVNNLIYWEHGEHFIEEIPTLVLTALQDTNWPVRADKLRSAIKQLHHLLPKEGEEMISCSAARPMGELLELLLRVEGDSALGLIREYSANRDPELAYLAYKILLRRKGLPAPEPQELQARMRFSDDTAPANLTQQQAELYTAAKVHHAMRNGNIEGVSADEFRQAQQYFRAQGLEKHATAIDKLFTKDELSQDPYTIQAAHHRYQELLSPAPGAVMARSILEHPEILNGASTASKK